MLCTHLLNPGARACPARSMACEPTLTDCPSPLPGHGTAVLRRKGQRRTLSYAVCRIIVRQSQEGCHRVVMNDADGYSAGEMISPEHLSALRLIHERLDKTPIVWVVTGSLGFAVRGMDVVVHDIDVQSDREG